MNADVEFIITKVATDAFLDRQKAEMKARGLDVRFSRVRRNGSGEINAIKISLSDGGGKESSASWKSTEQPIPDIVMGKSKDGSLVIHGLK